MRKIILSCSLVLVAVLMLMAPMTASAQGESATMMVPAGYRTIDVEFQGFDNVSMEDGNLSLTVNGAVDVSDVITLIDDQLAYGGSVEESCTTRMRWVPGTTRIAGASGSTLNLQSTLALAQRSCEPTMSMYTTSEHDVSYSVSIAGSMVSDLTLSIDVSSVAGLDGSSSISAGRLDQIVDANINPVQDFARAVIKQVQAAACLDTAEVSISPLAFSSDGSLSLGVNASGDLNDMSRCVLLDNIGAGMSLITDTSILPLLLSDLEPDTVTSMVAGALAGEFMSVGAYVEMVAADLADDTWRALVVEALSSPTIQEIIMAGMGDMIPAELATSLFSDAAREQIWGELILMDVNPDTLEALVVTMVGPGDGDESNDADLVNDLISQIQPGTIALALARLLTLG